MFKFIAFALLVQLAAVNSQKCVMYDLVMNEEHQRPYSYVYNGPPIEVDDASFQIFQSWCPDTAAEFGKELCCSPLQIEFLGGAFQNALFMMGTCPTCAHNWRTTFCNQWCSPRQSDFLRVNETVVDGEGKELAASLEFAIHQEFVDNSFASCKDVLQPLVGTPMIDFICGNVPQGSCTPNKWFDNMGDFENGGGHVIYSMTFLYGTGNDTVDGLQPLHPTAIPCHLAAPGVEDGCSCTDCPAAC